MVSSYYFHPNRLLSQRRPRQSVHVSILRNTMCVLLLLLVSSVYTVITSNVDDCRDEHEDCIFWASKNECDTNSDYMHRHCKVSCDVCDRNDDDEWGVKQIILGTHKKDVQDLLEQTYYYMTDEVSKPEYDTIRDECQHRHELCAFWAVVGECDENPIYMKRNCAPSCQTCELIDFNVRCPMDPNMKDIFEPHDLHLMFERIVNTTDVNQLTILSQPSSIQKERGGPWILIIDDFVSVEECNRLIKLGTEQGYKRSQDVGAMKFDGTYDSVKSSSRTSYNAWCNTDECSKDPHTQRVIEKMGNLTGIPQENGEHIQLLKYEPGQFYKIHHDFIDHQTNRPVGPRIITAFLYLNYVEAGGGTNFPQLDITVMPKQGRLLIWPSVYDDNLREMDERTYHQALPVEKGMKYGANAWLHLRDFKTNHGEDCTG